MKTGCWALAAALALAGCTQAPLLPSPAPSPSEALPDPAPRPSSDKERLQLSHQRWKAMRDAVPAYSYQVLVDSHTGFRSVTTVQVRQHQVSERRLQTQAGRGRSLDLLWVETGPTLSTHERGVPALTLDQLYSRAWELLEQPLRANEERSLGIDERGLLQHCFIKDRHLSDDAPLRGVAPMRLELH